MVGDASNRLNTSRGAAGASERAQVERLRLREPGRLGGRSAVDRCLVGQRTVGNVRDDSAVVLHAHPVVGRDLADAHGMEIPFVEDALDLGLAALLDDEQHALLGLGEHDFVRRHARLALRHQRDVDLDARAAARAHLAGRAGEAGRAHVLDADEGVGLHHLEARLEEKLLHERIADLHGRALLGGLVVELGRRHRRAMDAVAAGLGADVVHGVPDSGRSPLDDLVSPRNPQAEDVHQRIAGVALVEGDLAADGRDADAVSVSRDPGDDARHRPPHQRVVQGAEAERVQQRDGPRAHREDVADDAADSRRRALIGLDERGMVV